MDNLDMEFEAWENKFSKYLPFLVIFAGVVFLALGEDVFELLIGFLPYELYPSVRSHLIPSVMVGVIYILLGVIVYSHRFRELNKKWLWIYGGGIALTGMVISASYTYLFFPNHPTMFVDKLVSFFISGFYFYPLYLVLMFVYPHVSSTKKNGIILLPMVFGGVYLFVFLVTSEGASFVFEMLMTVVVMVVIGLPLFLMSRGISFDPT